MRGPLRIQPMHARLAPMRADNHSMTTDHRKRLLAGTVLLSFALPLAAQQPTAVQTPEDSTRSMGDVSPFRRLELPGPNTIRTGSDAPGDPLTAGTTRYGRSQARVCGERNAHAGKPAASAAAARPTGSRPGLVLSIRAQQQSNGHRAHRQQLRV